MALLRRLFLSLPAAAFARAGWANEKQPLKVGVLLNGEAGTPLAEAALKTLRQSFAALGYEEGRSLALRVGYAAGRLERHPALAKELIEANVDLIFALGGPAARAAANATSRIPVVFSIVTDPVALGLVQSMQAPGGNVTGITNLDPGQGGAQMKLLRELAPSISRVAILSDADIPGADASGFAPIERDNLAAAADSGFTARVIKLKGPTPDLDGLFSELAQQGAQAVVVLEVPVTLFHRQKIGGLALSHRMPSLFPGGTSDAGGLLNYGTTVADTWARMPAIAQRIVNGSPPGSVPVEVVTRRELVLNLKTAREIGLTVPKAIVDRADRRIE